MKQFLEDAESIALWKWAQYVPELRDHLIHIPNGGKRKKLEAIRFKRMGVRAGVSDYMLPIPRQEYHGCWIELKAGKGKPTEEQLDWITKMLKQGYYATVCWGWESAKERLQWYLGLGNDQIR